MEKKKSTAAPKFGEWEENVHYTTYFEKAARPTTPTPPNPNPNPNPNQIAAVAADLIRKRGDPSSSPQPRSSAASSQRSTASLQQPPPPSSSGGQFRPSAVTWELRNISRDDIQRNYDSSSSTSSTSRQLQNRGGRGEGVVAAARNYQQQVPYYDDNDNHYQPPPNRYGGSAPPTPQRGGGGYATPIEIMSGHKGGVGPIKFGDWEADNNYTQYFENPSAGKNKEKKPQQQKQTNNLMGRPTNNEYQKQQPRSTSPLQHHTKPTFLPEVQRPGLSTPPKSPSYDLLHNNTAAKKKSPRCWPFRFSSK